MPQGIVGVSRWMGAAPGRAPTGTTVESRCEGSGDRALANPLLHGFPRAETRLHCAEFRLHND